MKPSTLPVFVAVLTGILVWGVIILRAHDSSSQVNRLCMVLKVQVIRQAVAIGKPGSPGYAYYRQNPKERQRAEAQSRRFLNVLPC